MLLDERRRKILEVIERNGFISINALGSQLPASESTLRRDLEYLDRIGQIRRTRGGAAYVGNSLRAYEDRIAVAAPEKRSIGQAMANLLAPGETVLLDGGTTTFEVARALAGKSLQIVTNSLPIASLLMNRPEIELIFLGGYLYPKTGVTLGPIAVNSLTGIRANRLVMSVGGITEEGLFNTNSLLVETEQRMIESAEEVCVVSDSGKLGKAALAKIAPLSVVHHLITDRRIPQSWREHLAEQNIQLTIAEPTPNDSSARHD